MVLARKKAEAQESKIQNTKLMLKNERGIEGILG